MVEPPRSRPSAGSGWAVRRDRPAWCWRHKWADRTALGEPAPPAADGLLTLPYFLTPAGTWPSPARGNLCVRTTGRGLGVARLRMSTCCPASPAATCSALWAAVASRSGSTTSPCRSRVTASAVLHCSSVSGVRLVTAVDDRRCERGDRPATRWNGS